MRAPSPTAALCGLLAVAGCASPENFASQQQSVVYGEDDRRDVYDHPDPAWRQRARESVVALFQETGLDRSDPDNVRVIGPTLGDRVGLCEGERFRDHPTGSDCSGTLIDNDLVLTAGHCVRNAAACASQLFVFDYFYRSEGELETISEDDIYGCSEIVARELSGSLDYAVLRLDRPVGPERRPMPVRREDTALEAGSDLAIMGFGSGIPLKIDTGGQVANPRAAGLGRFTATLDAFGGNSGSGVFDSEGNVVGILVSGNRDYALDRRNRCTVVNELPEDRGLGEGCVYVARALDGLCAADPTAAPCSSNEEICGRCEEGACGEGLGCREDFCFATCGADDECPGAEMCIGGLCIPPPEPSCSGNNEALSRCGEVVEVVRDCEDEFCVEGRCEATENICPVREFLALNTTLRLTAERFGTSAEEGSCGGVGFEAAFGLRLEERSFVTIDAISNGGDPLLHVRRSCDDAGSEVLCNDDSSGRDPRVEGVLTAGTWTVFVDHFQGRSDELELRITATPASEPGDAGPAPQDAGTVFQDAGTVTEDAAVRPLDAGPRPVVERYTFRWCSASPGDHGRDLWGFALIVGLALRRRRR